MQKRSFLLLILFVFVCFLAANLAIARWSRRMPAIRKLAQVTQGSDANVLFIGNSLLDGHIDPAAFTRTMGPGNVPLDGALGAGAPTEQYLLLREGLKHPGIRQVVIGFYDFQLTQNPTAKVSELLSNGAIPFDPSVDPADVEFIYHLSFLDRLEFRTYRAIPLLAYRRAGWEKIELVRRHLGGIGMQQEAYNGLGRVADFAALESDSVALFDQEALAYGRRPAGFNLANEAMIDAVQARGLRLTYVLMPTSPYHQAEFYARASWPRYLDALRAGILARHANYIDASKWFLNEDDFVDHLHLDHKRSVEFTERLARALAAEDGATGRP